MTMIDESSINKLQTEGRNFLIDDLDALSALQLCNLFNIENSTATNVVANCVSSIASVIESLVPRIQSGGRLIYVGAGNSGRVGLMDACELPVTFSVNPEQYISIIAGGSGAALSAKESDEDNEEGGAAKIEELNLSEDDSVIGITASGRTPFVLGAIKMAKKLGSFTIGITNSKPSSIEEIGIDFCISAIVGPELIAGSTRLKAGTAAKLILNMISTCTMIRMGKTYKNLMVDVQVFNYKLKVRARRIIREICGSKFFIIEDGCISEVPVEVPTSIEGDLMIDELVAYCKSSVKLAAAVAMFGLPLVETEERLQLSNSSLRRFMVSTAESQKEDIAIVPTKRRAQDCSLQELFLAIDGGGTSCKVSIANQTGILCRGESGATNFVCVELDQLIEHVKMATLKACKSLPEYYKRRDNNLPEMKAVWAGFAGLNGITDLKSIAFGIQSLFNVSMSDGSLKLTTDGHLLTSCLGSHNDIDTGISIIAGTGCVATRFSKLTNGEIVQCGRVGGWGHLLGDEGSAFDIGKRALRMILERNDFLQDRTGNYQKTELEDVILKHLKCSSKDVLPNVLYSKEDPKLLIAGIARIVTALAFRHDSDKQALSILKSSVSAFISLLKPMTSQSFDPFRSILLLSGSLMNLQGYRELFISLWDKESRPQFRHIVVVKDVSDYAAMYLSQIASDKDKNRFPQHVSTNAFQQTQSLGTIVQN